MENVKHAHLSQDLWNSGSPAAQMSAPMRKLYNSTVLANQTSAKKGSLEWTMNVWAAHHFTHLQKKISSDAMFPNATLVSLLHWTENANIAQCSPRFLKTVRDVVYPNVAIHKWPQSMVNVWNAHLVQKLSLSTSVKRLIKARKEVWNNWSNHKLILDLKDKFYTLNDWRNYQVLKYWCKLILNVDYSS